MKSAGFVCGSPSSFVHVHLPSNAGGTRRVLTRRGSAPYCRENWPATIFDVMGSIHSVMPLARW